MNLNDALREFDLALYGEVKDSTRQWYQLLLSTLPDILGDIDVREIDASMLRRWRVDLFDQTTKYGKPYTTRSKNNFLRAAKRFFRWLKREGLIQKNPAKRLEYIPLGDVEPKNFDLEEFKTLLNELARGGKIRNVLIPLFLLGTGCRIGGLCGLKLSDIDMEHSRAYVYEKGRGASGKGRWVYLDDVVRHTLYLYIATERPKGVTDYLLVGRGRPLSTRSAWYILRNAARNAGIQSPMNPHSFRHTAAKLWLGAGANLSAVSAMLGHSDISTTHQFYARWQIEELQRQHERVSPVDQIVLGTSLLDTGSSSKVRQPLVREP